MNISMWMENSEDGKHINYVAILIDDNDIATVKYVCRYKIQLYWWLIKQVSAQIKKG
jgi:hypothetical protein